MFVRVESFAKYSVFGLKCKRVGSAIAHLAMELWYCRSIREDRTYSWAQRDLLWAVGIWTKAAQGEYNLTSCCPGARASLRIDR